MDTAVIEKLKNRSLSWRMKSSEWQTLKLNWRLNKGKKAIVKSPQKIYPSSCAEWQRPFLKGLTSLLGAELRMNTVLYTSTQK